MRLNPSRTAKGVRTRAVRVEASTGALEADLAVPDGASALIIFAHGSGSSRKSPRNRFVARELNGAGLATLLLDLLTADEEAYDDATARLRFDIPLLTARLVLASEWAAQERALSVLRHGFFGASTGAAAALEAAARLPERTFAVVSRGGRPDLAQEALPVVQAPTLLIVGGADPEVLTLNESAADLMTCERRVEIVPGATHLFEEPGALEAVARLAAGWFVGHLR